MNKIMVAVAIAGLGAVMAMSQPAHADVIYTLDTFTGSGSPPAPPYGTVNLHQDSANVDVTVTLAAGEGFVNTGAGAALTWDLNGEPVVTIENLDLTHFAVSHNGTSTGNLDGSGSWFYQIDCISCGSGGSNPYPGPLSFTIDNITIADFIINNKTATGYLFASDICTQIGVDGACAGITGDVVASDIPSEPTPEPATLALLGAGLLGFGVLGHRQQRAGSRKSSTP
jgi:hypothetical protein